MGTGAMEYDTPVWPHCPEAGPEMLPGVFGNPLPMPLARTAPVVGQLLLAETETVEPPGIEAGNKMLQDVPVPFTIAPATVVLQL